MRVRYLKYSAQNRVSRSCLFMQFVCTYSCDTKNLVIFVSVSLRFLVVVLCHRRRVAGLSICCTRLIRTLITVCSASFHLLLLELDISELRPQLIYWSLKYQGVERPNLLGISCLLRFDCGMTFRTLCLIPERWMGSRVQSTVGCFPKLCFLPFSVAHMPVGLRKQFINNFVFPTWAWAAVFNNNNNQQI